MKKKVKKTLKRVERKRERDIVDTKKDKEKLERRKSNKT